MRDEYDFSRSQKNPYSSKLKRQITIRIDSETIDYFKSLSKDTGIPYQNLMNMYLVECREQHKKPQISWE